MTTRRGKATLTLGPMPTGGAGFSPPRRLCGGLPVGCQLLGRPTYFPFVEGVGRRREELVAPS